MQRVGPQVRHSAVLLREPQGSPLAVLAAFALTRDGPLKPLDLLQVALERPEVLLNLAVRQGGEALHTQIHARYWPANLCHRLLMLDRTATYQCPACSRTVAERTLTPL